MRLDRRGVRQRRRPVYLRRLRARDQLRLPQLSVRPRHVGWFDQDPIGCSHHKRAAYDVQNSEADQTRDNDDCRPN